MDGQLMTAIDYAVAKASLANVGRKPDAESVYAVFSGPKDLSRVEFTPLVKKALNPFIAKGASVTPTFISYDNVEAIPSLLLLFGYPKVPEIRDILEEAKALIKLHSKGSDIADHWFKRSKGVTKEILLTAVNDLEQLFGSYMPTDVESK